MEVQDKTKNGQTFGIPYQAVWKFGRLFGQIFQQNRLSMASQKESGLPTIKFQGRAVSFSFREDLFKPCCKQPPNPESNGIMNARTVAKKGVVHFVGHDRKIEAALKERNDILLKHEGDDIISYQPVTV